MKKIIFHIDVNSAYLSWTAIKLLRDGSNTDLRKIPAIVGGDMSKRHGVVLAKSMSAARYGIRTGEPITDALRKCASLTIVPPEHHYYSVCSHQLLDLLHHYTPSISQYSIDECFAEYVPVPGDNGDPVKAAHIIKDVIRNKLGFTVNVGISTNRLLAKMASDFEKPDKVHTLFPEEIPVKMWPLPVKDLFMVGRSSASKLELLGIKTIGDLAKMDPTLIEAHLKSHGRTIWEYANGIESVHIDDRTKNRHLQQGSRQFHHTVNRCDNRRRSRKSSAGAVRICRRPSPQSGFSRRHGQCGNSIQHLHECLPSDAACFSFSGNTSDL